VKLTLHLKISGWKMNFLLGLRMFSGKLLVSGRVSPKVHIQQLKAGVLEAKFRDVTLSGSQPTLGTRTCSISYP